MTVQDTTGGRAPGHRRAAPDPAPVGAAERAVLAAFEDRSPAVIASQRRRQAILNREARDACPCRRSAC